MIKGGALLNSIVFYGVAPHPPILLPEVGGADSKKVDRTFAAMQKFASQITESGAETVILISPHGAVFSDGVAINGNVTLSGDLKQFRADLTFAYSNDLVVVNEIIQQAGKRGIAALGIDDSLAGEYGITTRLDHGVLVPMYFLDKAGIKLPVVSISMSMLPFEELYAFGAAIKDACTRLGRKAALIASGDMSHRLTPDAPAGYSEKGAVFDRAVADLLAKKDFRGILSIDMGLAEAAGECGLRSIIMMLGAVDGVKVDAEVLSYEGPFGVGYMVAMLKPLEGESESLLKTIFNERAEKIGVQRAVESELVGLARRALERYVREGKKIYPDTGSGPLLKEKAGVFVSLKKHGQLRGCIGTIVPTTDNIGFEIVNNAISAGTGDPRFEPVEPGELDELVYSVDVLKPAEPIDNMSQLDVRRYGVIVRSGRRSGLLLPNLEGIDTVEQQVAIARQKAGIGPDEPVQLQRFEVVRYY